ncbi:hypothetical protein PWT90_05046 [Aphanocladium album]|nr:hypothetical protein PWT90_05046 [Aphanocladium album]
MFGILEAVAIPRAGIYSSYEDLIENLNERMEKEGYKIVKARSHRSRMGGADVPNNDIVRCDLVCDRGGRPYKCMATKHKTTTKKTDCPWKAKAVNRKAVGGWVLTVLCDQHNHEPGTPEPPSPEHSDGEEDHTENSIVTIPTLGAETSSAIQVAGVSEATLRLSGDTFNQFKGEYRKLSHADRLQMLSTLQLRIAAIYAIQNEDMQRQQRQDAQDRRHREVDTHRRSQQSSISKAHKRQRSSIVEDPDSEPEALHDQLHAGGQLLGQQLMVPSHFQLDHGAVQTAVPIPNIDMSHFQQFTNAPKRGRGPNS